MNAFIPTVTQAENALFVACLVLAIAAVLGAAWWISDYGIDLVVARWNRKRAHVIDFAERRKWNAIQAMRSGR